MSQRRMGVILGGVVLALAAVSVPAYAQGPQRGNRGGGPGGGPGGGRGGFTGGFGGRGGGSLVDLAGREPVQKEIQVTEEQKPQIQNLAQETRSRRDRTMQQLRQRNDQAQSRARNTRPNIPIPQANNVPVNPGGYGDVGGYGSTPFGGNVQNQGPSPAQLQQMAEQQQRQQERMVRMQGFEQMRQVMDGLQRQSDQSLAKILNKEQMTRLREIQLQMEGPFAPITNAELAQKLSITPQQRAEISDIQNQANQIRRQNFQQRREIFEAARNSAQPNAGAEANAGGQPNAGAQANGQQGGRGGRGNFDWGAIREAMQKPEVQAQLDQLQQHEASLRDQSYARVFKALDRGQASKFKKMLGQPFDTAGMMRSFFAPRNGDSQQPADGEAPAASANANADDDGDAPAVKAPAPAPAAETAPAPAAEKAPAPAPVPSNRRSSLRERRGLGPAPRQ